jgi:hypothetical protein
MKYFTENRTYKRDFPTKMTCKNESRISHMLKLRLYWFECGEQEQKKHGTYTKLFISRDNIKEERLARAKMFREAQVAVGSTFWLSNDLSV